MMYLLAILFPPIAVFMSGKPIQGIISIFLTMMFWIPGSIHALFVVHERKADKRMERQVKLQAKYNK